MEVRGITRRSGFGQRSVWAWTLLSLVALLPADVRSQESTLPSPGERIRVSGQPIEGGGLTGTFSRVERDTLVLEADPTGDITRVPIQAISALEVSIGQRSRWARGLGLGFLMGAVVGAAWGAGSAGTDDGAIDLPTGTAAGMAALVFGAGGGTLGLLIGSTQRSDVWETVQVPEIVPGLARTRTGLQIGLSWSIPFR